MITEIRCSKLSRPMVCAGSLFFDDLHKEEENPAAKEGTAAGEYLETMLRQGHTKVANRFARNGVEFTDDMRFYTEPIFEEIKARATSEILCEQRIDWQTRSGIWIRGSYDISYVSDGILYIDDFKYGWGLVEVKENWQLLGYAIGEIIRRGVAFDKIILRIHQPRPHHEDGSTRAWGLTYHELLGYKEKIEARMDQLAANYRDLQTGPQCKYCPAAAERCPAFGKVFHRGIDIVHEFVQDGITEHELAFQLDLIARVNEIMKIKLDSLNALAVHRIKEGKIIPGYMTESRYGDRRWKPGTDPAIVEILTGRKIVEQTMLSPAKAEKLGIPKDVINSMVDRPFLGQKIVKKDASEIGNKIFNKQEK